MNDSKNNEDTHRVTPIQNTIVKQKEKFNQADMIQNLPENKVIDQNQAENASMDQQEADSRMCLLESQENPLLTQKAVMNTKNYFLMYYFHVLYYLTLGPVFFVLFFWIPQIRNSLRNLLFIRINPWCFFQNAYWASTITIVIMSIFIREYTTIDEAFFYTALINTFFRSATIAGKYGTYPQVEVSKVFNTLILPSKVRGEMMIDAWNGQKETVVDEELYSIKKRENMQENSHQIVSVEVDGNLATKSSDDIIKEMINAYARCNTQPILKILVFLFAICRTFAIGFLNIWVGLPFHGEKTEEIVVFYLVFLWEFMYFSVGPMFFLLAFKDVKRKLYMGNRILEILEQQAVKDTNVSRVPLESPAQSDQASSVMCMINKMDKFGDRFSQRHAAFVTFIMYHAWFIELALVAKYFDLFKYSKYDVTEKKLQFLLVVDLVTLAVPLCCILVLIHRVIIMKKKIGRVISGLEVLGRSLYKYEEYGTNIIFMDVSSLVSLVCVVIIYGAGIAGGVYVVVDGKYKIG